MSLRRKMSLNTAMNIQMYIIMKKIMIIDQMKPP